MHTRDFIPALQFVQHAAPKADVRHMLCGIYMDIIDSNNMTLVGCDGHRLAMIDVAGPHGMEKNAIIAIGYVKDLIEMFKPKSKKEKPVELSITGDGSTITFLTEDRHLVCECVVAEYPSYHELLNHDVATNEVGRVSIDHYYLMQAAKAAGFITSNMNQQFTIGKSSPTRIFRADIIPTTELNLTNAIIGIMPINT